MNRIFAGYQIIITHSWATHPCHPVLLWQGWSPCTSLHPVILNNAATFSNPDDGTGWFTGYNWFNPWYQLIKIFLYLFHSVAINTMIKDHYSDPNKRCSGPLLMLQNLLQMIATDTWTTEPESEIFFKIELHNRSSYSYVINDKHNKIFYKAYYKLCFIFEFGYF